MGPFNGKYTIQNYRQACNSSRESRYSWENLEENAVAWMVQNLRKKEQDPRRMWTMKTRMELNPTFVYNYGNIYGRAAEQ